MSETKLSIGAVAKQTGIPVKTLRFWSDQGLVPPSGRTRSGYRQYTRDDLAKLELVRTLRDAGLGLREIGAVLRRELSLRAALELRLVALDAHIGSLRNVAAALRATLRADQPSEDALRRLQTVTQLSNDERRATIARFYEQVAEGLPVDARWQAQMVDALSPNLPEQPSEAQLDAWIELSEILADPGFVQAMRAASQQTWTPNFDFARYQQLSNATMEEARDALARGIAFDGAEARAIVERFVNDVAGCWQREPDASFRADLLRRYQNHDARAERVWELRAVLNGGPVTESKLALHRWLLDAQKYWLARV